MVITWICCVPSFPALYAAIVIQVCMPYARYPGSDILKLPHHSAPALLAAKRSIINNLSWRLAYPGKQARGTWMRSALGLSCSGCIKWCCREAMVHASDASNRLPAMLASDDDALCPRPY